MDLEFLIVGTAKEDKDDFKNLYNATCDSVYTFALACVKDKELAQSILIETYKRVYLKASSYVTDINAEYWIMSITKNISDNVLVNKDLQSNIITAKRDGFSKLLSDVLFNLKVDRGQLLILKGLTTLKHNDIAKLLWYYKSSEKKEFTLALKELKQMHKDINSSNIMHLIQDNAKNICPDIWNSVIDAKPTILQHISDEDCPVDPNYNETPKLPKRNKRKFFVFIITFILIIALFITGIFLYIKKKNDVVEINVQVGSKMSLLETYNTLYFQNMKKGGVLYSMDLTTLKKTKLCDDKIKELTTDGEFLFYRNENDGRLYRINKDGSNKIKISQNAGNSIAIDGDWLYYSESNGIYRMKKDGSGREEVILIDRADLYRYKMVVSEGKLYFSCGAGGGIFYVNREETIPKLDALYTSEAYDFQVVYNNLYFDILNYEMKSNGKQIKLYKINLSDGKLSQVSDDLLLTTSAMYIFEGKIILDGYKVDQVGQTIDSGIYSINLDGSDQKLLFEDTASTIYVSDNKIYCYYPEKGSRLLIYDKNNLTAKPTKVWG